MLRRVLGLVLTVLLLCGTLTGFAAAEEKTKIYYLSNRIVTGAAFSAAKQIADLYTAEHPEIEFVFENIHEKGPYYQKLKTLIASGNVPDMFDIDADPYCEELVRAGLLANLGTYFDAKDLWNHFYESALVYQEMPGSGNLYTFPMEYNIEMLWYNTDYFKACGLEKPTTMDEFLTTCQTLKENGYTPVAMGAGDRWQLLRYLAMIPFRMEGNAYIYDARKGARKFSEPLGVQAAQFVKTMGGYFQEGFAATDYTTALNMFLDGKTAMLHMGSWEMNTFSEKNLPDALKGKLDYFTLPMMDGAKTGANEYVCNSGIGLAFSEASFEKTKGYVEFLANNYGKLYTELGMTSPVKYDIPAEVYEGMDPLFKRIKADMDAYGEEPLRPWDALIDPDTYSFLGEGAVMVAMGDLSPEDYCAQLDEMVAAIADVYYPES